ncbi:MAG: hypothetical protein Tsb002_27820 [Wenzhouxiangellaceae bacterium]
MKHEEQTRILGRQLARELTDEEIHSVSGGYSCPQAEQVPGEPHSGEIYDNPY